MIKALKKILQTIFISKDVDKKRLEEIKQLNEAFKKLDDEILRMLDDNQVIINDTRKLILMCKRHFKS